jgi:glutaredoxin-related protein
VIQSAAGFSSKVVSFWRHCAEASQANIITKADIANKLREVDSEKNNTTIAHLAINSAFKLKVTRLIIDLFT